MNKILPRALTPRPAIRILLARSLDTAITNRRSWPVFVSFYDPIPVNATVADVRGKDAPDFAIGTWSAVDGGTELLLGDFYEQLEHPDPRELAERDNLVEEVVAVHFHPVSVPLVDGRDDLGSAALLAEAVLIEADRVLFAGEVSPDHRVPVALGEDERGEVVIRVLSRGVVILIGGGGGGGASSDSSI